MLKNLVWKWLVCLIGAVLLFSSCNSSKNKQAEDALLIDPEITERPSDTAIQAETAEAELSTKSPSLETPVLEVTNTNDVMPTATPVPTVVPTSTPTLTPTFTPITCAIWMIRAHGWWLIVSPTASHPKVTLIAMWVSVPPYISAWMRSFLQNNKQNIVAASNVNLRQPPFITFCRIFQEHREKTNLRQFFFIY